MIQDLRYAIRLLARNKVLTLVALLSVGLGIGINTALFSLVDAMELRRLNVPNPSELVLFRWNTHEPPPIPSVIFDGVSKDSAGRIHLDSFSHVAFQQFRAAMKLYRACLHSRVSIA